jgi:hypothetical protein
MHPEISGIDEDGSAVKTRNILSTSESYDDFLNSLKHLRRYREPQKKLMAIRINRTISDYAELVREIQEGIDLLEERHSIGVQEMIRFMDSVKASSKTSDSEDHYNKYCIRKSFATAVGRKVSDEATCIESIRDHREPVMPCSICRRHPWLRDKRLPQEAFLFSTPEVMGVLKGHEQYYKEDNVKPFFKLADGQISSLNMHSPYRIENDGLPSRRPKDGDYGFSENGGSIGNLKIANGNVTFTSLPRGGYLMWFDNSIVFVQEGNSIVLERS